jgi:O-antigen ligase
MGRDGPPAAWLAAAAIALVGGWSVATGRTPVVLLLLGPLAAVALARTPTLAYVFLLGGVATVAASSPRIGLSASMSTTLAEVLLLVALVAIYRARPPLRLLGVEIALIGFLVSVALGVVVGLSKGATFAEAALTDARTPIFALSFWPALVALWHPRSRRFVFWAAAFFACITVLLQVAQVLLGPAHVLFYSTSPFQELITCPGGPCRGYAHGFPRVRPPGLILVYIVCCFSISYLLWGPRVARARAIALLVVTLGGVALSLNRNMIVGLSIGVLAALVTARHRGRVVSVSVIVASVLLVPMATNVPFTGEFTKRVATLAKPQTIQQSPSVTDREYESRRAIATIKRNPIEGIGWGTSYGAITRDESGGVIPRRWIHNQYIGLWLRVGAAGLLSWLSVIGISLCYALRVLRRQRNSGAWLASGVVTSLIAYSISALVGIYVLNVPSLVGVMAVIALAAALHCESTRESLNDRGLHA